MRFFRWYRSGGLMTTWTTTWFVVFVFIGGFTLGLQYATSVSAAKLTEILEMMSFPLWTSAGVIVVSLIGIEHSRRTNLKIDAELAALKAEREADEATRAGRL